MSSGNKSLAYGIMILLMQMILIAVLVPSSILKRASDIEYEWLSASYSDSSMKWIMDRADSWHWTLTRETGLADGLSFIFLPERDFSRAKGMDRIGDRVWYPFIEGRGEALDEMVKITIVRVISILIWVPLLLLIFVPAFFDGYMQRLIRQYTFQYPSPFLYRYGAKVGIIGSFLLFAVIMAPIPIPPILGPIGCLVLVVVFAMVVVPNLPKRL